jgi:hypothetical protein
VQGLLGMWHESAAHRIFSIASIRAEGNAELRSTPMSHSVA